MQANTDMDVLRNGMGAILDPSNRNGPTAKLIIDPNRPLAIYDAMSRRTQVLNGAIQSAPLLQQAYTPAGLLASFTVARNNTTFATTTLAYDGHDRLATTTYPDTSFERLTYDGNGNVLSRRTRAGASIAFTYDTLNRLKTKAPPSQPVVTYAYDLKGQLIGTSDTSAAITAPTPPGGPLVASAS